ncbi:hypothetical protein LTR56_025895 [Elasticomyces elasticus]|nr:hypothetical protein LTR56_025895 [Elasticomyces elasticus]KAK5742708.1 hypothetical protein LTS12_024160 [Elasticomyces elasticus]
MKRRCDAPLLPRSASYEASSTAESATRAQSGQTPGVGAGWALGCVKRSVRSTAGQQNSESVEAVRPILNTGACVRDAGDTVNMIAGSANADYLAASCYQDPQPGRGTESDNLGIRGQSVRSGVPFVAADTVMSMDRSAGSDALSPSRLLLLYQEKEGLLEEVERICTRIVKDQADITKLQLLAARYMEAAEQRAKLLSGLKEQERTSNERILQIKDEIKRLEI